MVCLKRRRVPAVVAWVVSCVVAVVGSGALTASPAHAVDTAFTTVNESGHQLTPVKRGGNYALAPAAVPVEGSGSFRVVFYLGQTNEANLRYAIGSTGYQLALTATPGYATYPASLRCTVRDAADAILASGTGPFRCTVSGTSVTVAAAESVYVGNAAGSAVFEPVTTDGAVLPGSATVLPIGTRVAFRSWAGAAARVVYAVRLPSGDTTPRVWVSVARNGTRTCGGDLPCSVAAGGTVSFGGTKRVSVGLDPSLDGGLTAVHDPFASMTDAPGYRSVIVEVGTRAVYRLSNGDEVVLTRTTPQAPVTCESTRTDVPHTVCFEPPGTSTASTFRLDEFYTSPWIPPTRAAREIDISAVAAGVHRDALVAAITEWNDRAGAGWRIGSTGSAFQASTGVPTDQGGSGCEGFSGANGTFVPQRSGQQVTGGRLCAVDRPTDTYEQRKRTWLHELGHALGLAHDRSAESVMHETGTPVSTLHPKDIAVFTYRQAHPTAIRVR